MGGVCDAIEKLAKDAVKLFEEYGKSLKAKWEKVKSLVSDGADAILAGLKKLGNSIVEMAKKVGEFLAKFACDITPKDIANLFDVFGVSDMRGLFTKESKEFDELRGLDLQGESAKDATEVKAVGAIGGAVCGTVFAALTLAGSPITIIANVLKLIQGKCKWFGDPKKNMAITIGTTGGVGADAAMGAAIGGGLGLEVGVGVALDGTKFCYLGGCGTTTVGVGPKGGVSASASVGVAVSFFNDIAAIPGSCRSYGFGLDLEVTAGIGAGAGFGLDFFTDVLFVGKKDSGLSWDMFKNTFGGSVSLSVSVSAGAGGGIAGGVSFGECYAPLCVRTDGLGCDGKTFAIASQDILGLANLEAEYEGDLEGRSYQAIEGPDRVEKVDIQETDDLERTDEEKAEILEAFRQRIRSKYYHLFEREVEANLNHGTSLEQESTFKMLEGSIGELESSINLLKAERERKAGKKARKLFARAHKSKARKKHKALRPAEADEE